MLTHEYMIIPGDIWFILDRTNKKQTNCSVQDSEFQTRDKLAEQRTRQNHREPPWNLQLGAAEPGHFSPERKPPASPLPPDASPPI